MDDQKKLEKAFNRMKKKTFLTLSQLGVSIDELERDFEICLVPVGNINALKDFIWGQFNKHLARHPTDFQKQHSIYKSMAHFNYDYSDGKRVLELKKLAMHAYKMSNESALKNEYMLAIIIGSHTSCPVCRAEESRTMEVNDCFYNYILPHENCTCEGFGCCCEIGFIRNSKNIPYDNIELTDDDD